MFLYADLEDIIRDSTVNPATGAVMTKTAVREALFHSPWGWGYEHSLEQPVPFAVNKNRINARITKLSRRQVCIHAGDPELFDADGQRAAHRRIFMQQMLPKLFAGRGAPQDELLRKTAKGLYDCLTGEGDGALPAGARAGWAGGAGDANDTDDAGRQAASAWQAASARYAGAGDYGTQKKALLDRYAAPADFFFQAFLFSVRWTNVIIEYDEQIKNGARRKHRPAAVAGGQPEPAGESPEIAAGTQPEIAAGGQPEPAPGTQPEIAAGNPPKPEPPSKITPNPSAAATPGRRVAIRLAAALLIAIALTAAYLLTQNTTPTVTLAITSYSPIGEKDGTITGTVTVQGGSPTDYAVTLAVVSPTDGRTYGPKPSAAVPSVPVTPTEDRSTGNFTCVFAVGSSPDIMAREIRVYVVPADFVPTEEVERTAQAAVAEVVVVRA